MLLDVRCLVIAVLALLPDLVTAAEPRPGMPSKETIAAFEKLRSRLVRWSEPGIDIPLSFA